MFLRKETKQAGNKGVLMGKLIDSFGWLSGLSVILMALLVFVEVISRYLFQDAFMVGDEYSAYLLIWCVFLGLGYTMREGGHIRVTAVAERMSSRGKNRLRLITLIVFSAYVLVFAIYCTKLVFWTHRLGLRSETWIETPQYVIQIIMPIGLFAFLLELLIEIKNALRSLRYQDLEQ